MQRSFLGFQILVAAFAYRSRTKAAEANGDFGRVQNEPGPETMTGQP